jgi:CheY-like chemotaxis protein
MILNGWKEIAQHLGRGVRTVQRWEILGLPVRRPRSKSRSAVVAFADELDSWLKSASSSLLSTSDKESVQSGQGFKRRVLLADDDERLLVTQSAMFLTEGYEFKTAKDGFEALAEMRAGIADVLISDLQMPNMSGFELLSVVRRRFPSVTVIAMSGEFTPATLPAVLCDLYIEKGSKGAVELLGAVRELLARSPLRPQPAKSEVAPAWVPRTTNGYVVLTCVACLRSFPVKLFDLKLDEEAVQPCIHCGEKVRYRVDGSWVPAASDLAAVKDHSTKLKGSLTQRKRNSYSG